MADAGVSWGRTGPPAAATVVAAVSPPLTSTLGGAGGGGSGGGVARRTGRPVLCGTCSESFDGRRAPSDEADAAELGSAFAAVAESGAVAVVGVGESVPDRPGAGAMGREGKVE